MAQDGKSTPAGTAERHTAADGGGPQLQNGVGETINGTPMAVDGSIEIDKGSVQETSPVANPTVKSLDERVDALETAVHTEIADVKKALVEEGHKFEIKIQAVAAEIATQLAMFRAEIATQMAMFRTELVTQIVANKVETASQLADLRTDLQVFKKEVTISLNFAKWVSGFAAAIIISLLGIGWSFSSANGEMKQKVEHLSKQVDELKQILQKKP